MMEPGQPHCAVLRRAVLHVKPDFYEWDAASRLHYRMHMPEDERFALERSIFRDLYGIDCPDQQALDDAWRDLPLGQLNPINEALLPWWGIGEDSFFLNEHLPDAKILSFETLDDYVRDDHAFQQSARQKEAPAHQATPYRGDLYSCWARLFVDGQFRYATLNSLAGHLSMQISMQGHDLVDQLIPHHYVPGPDHGKTTKDGIIWDQHPDAGGLEAQLQELRKRLIEYETRRWNELLDEFDRHAATAIYIQDIAYEADDDQLHFIFTDKSAMQRVRLTHFLRDCRELQHDDATLTRLEQRETDALREFVHKQHAGVMSGGKE